MTLQKAKLIPKDGGKPIEFMFNPTELSFEKTVETSENKGARTQDQGQPKVGFATVDSYIVTINKILFDTYETGENVVTKYIEPFRKAVQFVSKAEQRTPRYTFTWGGNQLLRCCFVKKLNYKLTMFLPDGTPVRATIDSLTLKEADEPKPNVPLNTPTVSNTTRQQQTMQNRQNGSITSPRSMSPSNSPRNRPSNRR
jgi:Contractile injection system tube protein